MIPIRALNKLNCSQELNVAQNALSFAISSLAHLLHHPHHHSH